MRRRGRRRCCPCWTATRLNQAAAPSSSCWTGSAACSTDKAQDSLWAFGEPEILLRPVEVGDVRLVRRVQPEGSVLSHVTGRVDEQRGSPRPGPLHVLQIVVRGIVTGDARLIRAVQREGGVLADIRCIVDLVHGPHAPFRSTYFRLVRVAS